MAGNGTHDNSAAPMDASTDASNVRWWDLPFDANTSFSLLGYFIEAGLEEPGAAKKIDLVLK